MQSSNLITTFNIGDIGRWAGEITNGSAIVEGRARPAGSRRPPNHAEASSRVLKSTLQEKEQPCPRGAASHRLRSICPRGEARRALDRPQRRAPRWGGGPPVRLVARRARNENHFRLLEASRRTTRLRTLGPEVLLHQCSLAVVRSRA